VTTNDPYRPEDPTDPGDERKSNRKSKITRIIPEPLRHWQVADADDDLANDWETVWDDAWQPFESEGEILEGEATVIDAPAIDSQAVDTIRPTDATRPPEHTPDAPNVAHPPIADLYDTIIVAGLDSDHLVVNPGMAATFHVRVLNNGRKRATFSVHVEGWIDERWITVYPVNTQLQPGEQATLTVAVAPPRLPTSLAGDHAVAIIVRSSDHPDRQSRLGATLTINAFDEIAPSGPQPRRARVSWHQQTATVRLPVSNRGNRPVTVRIRGRSAEPACRFEFVHPQSGVRQPGECLVNLPPGQSANVSVHITPDSLPLFGLHPQTTPYWLSTTISEQQRTPREVNGQLVGRPLIGIWQLLAAGTMTAAALLIIALLALGGLFTVQLATRAAQPAPVTEPAVVAIMLNMQQPAPTAPAAPTAVQVLPPPVQQSLSEALPETRSDRASQPATDQANAPIVQANQVTAPGAIQDSSAPVVSAPPAQPPTAPTAPPAQTHEGMTYSAMFKEVGRRYDLDWRMLAAQAYVESNFDSVALGQSGALGLMQVRPNTWREWAPGVGATDPFDSYSSVLVAAAYLNYLRDLFGQRGYVEPKWMLVAYNWGPDKLLTFINSDQQWESLDPSLRRYAEDILGIAEGIPVE